MAAIIQYEILPHAALLNFDSSYLICSKDKHAHNLTDGDLTARALSFSKRNRTSSQFFVTSSWVPFKPEQRCCGWNTKGQGDSSRTRYPVRLATAGEKGSGESMAGEPKPSQSIHCHGKYHACPLSLHDEEFGRSSQRSSSSHLNGSCPISSSQSMFNYYFGQFFS